MADTGGAGLLVLAMYLGFWVLPVLAWATCDALRGAATGGDMALFAGAWRGALCAVGAAVAVVLPWVAGP